MILMVDRDLASMGILDIMDHLQAPAEVGSGFMSGHRAPKSERDTTQYYQPLLLPLQLVQVTCESFVGSDWPRIGMGQSSSQNRILCAENAEH